MNDKQDFEKLVDEAMSNAALSAMRQVVEKELLHYEIFQALDSENLLKDLVFQGGTALRLCRGSERFSEDLDFAGGPNFSAVGMERIKECVEKRIGEKFGLKVSVSNKPAKVGGDGIDHVKVDKWWISIETAPGNHAMPRQKIKLEIANIPAHTSELVPLRANYESTRAMPKIYVTTESLAEIMADKVLAFPTSLLDNLGRPAAPDSAKIRHRDIWDLTWMTEQGVKLDSKLVETKIGDYGVEGYREMLDHTIERLPALVKSQQFKDQMTRFIDSDTVAKTLSREAHFDYFANAVGKLFAQMRAELSATRQPGKTAATPLAIKAAPPASPEKIKKASRKQDRGLSR